MGLYSLCVYGNIGHGTTQDPQTGIGVEPQNDIGTYVCRSRVDWYYMRLLDIRRQDMGPWDMMSGSLWLDYKTSLIRYYNDKKSQ